MDGLLILGGGSQAASELLGTSGVYKVAGGKFRFELTLLLVTHDGAQVPLTL